MKREFTDENGVHHITHDCTPEQLKEFQERINRNRFAAELNEKRKKDGDVRTTKMCKGTQGYDPELTTYEEHQKWLVKIKKKQKEREEQEVIRTMEQVEEQEVIPLKRITRIWDWLTEPKISFVAMFAGTLAGQLLIKLVNWGLR